MNNMNIERSLSAKGKPVLVVNGYSFRRKKLLKSGECYWGCTKNMCRAKVFTNGDSNELSPRTNINSIRHTHPCDRKLSDRKKRLKLQLQLERAFIKGVPPPIHSLTPRRPPPVIPRSSQAPYVESTFSLNSFDHFLHQSSLHLPGGGSAGSPSSPNSVPIAPKKLSSIVASTSSMPSTLPSSTPSVPPPPPPEVCLRWNSYHSNMQATFPTLLNNEQFVDVTLACEGRSIKCHKVMLSACSSYFEELLSQNPCQHPIVFMRDLKFWEVQALVEFMYSGEVNVAQEKLPSLLAAAEALQIKGLTGPTQSSGPQDENDYIPAHESEDTPHSQSSHKRVRKRKSTNPMAYPSRQSQPSPKQMPMMHPIVQLSNPASSSVCGVGGISTQPHSLTSSPNRKDSTSSSSSYHPPIKIKKERESTPPLALIKEEPLDLGKDSMETGSNNGHDLSNASSYHASINYDRSQYSGRTMANKPQNGLSDEEDRSSTHSNQSDGTKSPIEEKPDPGDDMSDV